MEDDDLVKVVDFIEGYYNRKLDVKEIKIIKEELKDYDYEKFMANIKFPLLKKVEYFTVQKLYQIIEDDRELEAFKEHLGIKSFEELYEN